MIGIGIEAFYNQSNYDGIIVDKAMCAIQIKMPYPNPDTIMVVDCYILKTKEGYIKTVPCNSIIKINNYDNQTT